MPSDVCQSKLNPNINALEAVIKALYHLAWPHKCPQWNSMDSCRFHQFGQFPHGQICEPSHLGHDLQHGRDHSPPRQREMLRKVERSFVKVQGVENANFVS